MRSILLLAYKFPPYRAVGSHRWSLFTRYLADLGHEIHVLTVDWDPTLYPQPSEEAPWPSNVTIHRLHSGYPHNLVRRHRSTRLGRIVRNRLTMALNNVLYWDDEAQHWDRHVIPYARKLIHRTAIDVVIATGSPFQAMRWAADICRQTHKPLILDFRDPWFHEPIARFPSASHRGKRILQWESQTVAQSAALVSVTRGMDQQFRERYPNLAKTTVIYNGYNPAALPDRVPQAHTTTFTYIGSINSGREIPADIFLKAVARRNAQQAGIRVRFVGNINPRMDSAWDEYEKAGWLERIPTVSQSAAFDYVQQSKFALYFGTDNFAHALSTKIYEYGALQVPVLALHYGGEIEWLIREHSLGYSVNLNTDSLDDQLDQALAGSKTFSFDIKRFAYPNLAAQYSALVEKL